MNLQRTASADFHASVSAQEAEQAVPTPREVLQELFQLLEEYAPTWYTEQHHDRAVAALFGRGA